VITGGALRDGPVVSARDPWLGRLAERARARLAGSYGPVPAGPYICTDDVLQLVSAYGILYGPGQDHSGMRRSIGLNDCGQDRRRH